MGCMSLSIGGIEGMSAMVMRAMGCMGENELPKTNFTYDFMIDIKL